MKATIKEYIKEVNALSIEASQKDALLNNEYSIAMVDFINGYMNLLESEKEMYLRNLKGQMENIIDNGESYDIANTLYYKYRIAFFGCTEEEGVIPFMRNSMNIIENLIRKS